MLQITELDVQLWTLYTTAVIALIGFFLMSFPYGKRGEQLKICQNRLSISM